MCGGPSLPEQVEAAGDADWLRISVNEHGCKLTQCDYIVPLDNIPDKIINFGVPVIGFFSWAKYRLLNFWNSGNSGMQAVWAAHAMGCNPIVIAGADCYTGGTYWWDADAESSGNNTALENHLNGWQQVKDKCPMAAIRSVGGPLAGVFGAYEAGADYDRPKPFEIQDHDWGSIVQPGTLIKILNACAVRGEHYESQRLARVSRQDAHQLVTLGKAEYSKEVEDVDRERVGSVSVPDDIRPKRDGRRKRGARAAG
jgi:hypothetical protein